MIGALTGTVFANNRNPIIIMVSGVGYNVFVANRLINELKTDAQITLFTQTYVRDDALDLFGFTTFEELKLFELLQTVSGVGPRTALAVIDKGVSSVEKAVIESDVDFFTTIPRLGKKNAQKIIIELKSKLGSVRELDLNEVKSGETKEIIEALISMGFSHREAVGAIKKLDSSLKLEDKIRQALKNLSRS